MLHGTISTRALAAEDQITNLLSNVNNVVDDLQNVGSSFSLPGDFGKVSSFFHNKLLNICKVPLIRV